MNNCVRVRCHRIITSRHAANKPEVVELVEDSWRPVKDVDLARRNVERSHRKTVRKRANEERADCVDRSHLVGQHGSLRFIVVDQKHLTCSRHEPHTGQESCYQHTAVSAADALILLVVHVCGTVYRRFCGRSLATNNFSGDWKHLCENISVC